MVYDEDLEPDDLLADLIEEDEEEVADETELAEELDFEDQRIRGYADVLTDLDQREKEMEIEEPEAEPEASE